MKELNQPQLGSRTLVMTPQIHWPCRKSFKYVFSYSAADAENEITKRHLYISYAVISKQTTQLSPSEIAVKTPAILISFCPVVDSWLSQDLMLHHKECTSNKITNVALTCPLVLCWPLARTKIFLTVLNQSETIRWILRTATVTSKAYIYLQNTFWQNLRTRSFFRWNCVKGC